ncbi:MAG: serine hydrolase [Holophaga sp.]|nr:serine hydrolase [Holophaga sp.]
MAVSPNPARGLHPEFQRRLDAVVDGALAAERIAGTVLLACVDGRVVYRRAAGFLDPEAGRPMREDAIFRLASVSKVVVAAATLALVGQGRLALDDPAETILPAEMGRNHTGALPIIGWPGWGYGLGFSVLLDPEAAGSRESPGTWRWGGAYGHSWFVDPLAKLSVVAFTNTALEGMSGGRFPQDICRAIHP